MKREYKCDPGEYFYSGADKPIIFVTGSGRNAYLWIGNDERDSKFCFGTLSAPKALQLAESILAAIKPKKKRRSKP